MEAPKKPSEVLEAAAALIEPEGAWTTGIRARTATGLPIEPVEQDAVCWCAVGAVERVSPQYAYTPYAHPALRWVRRVIRLDEVGYWNDRPNRTQAEVVAALRQAAELARAEGQ
ncbi:hypothetical protein [Phenylobacterium sp. J367]|uniref:DUF6197 family protein n=1 Tax=Phenylobacterium sp. J367 TaxID=2898435 RepID=UPI0021514829|nr:hypothetical protein [Phenylobacterium sp. J367]MCR5876963.1 hypothetical protein [Phenylobacterium sp. J367]MCR5877031.1 hypothetical protein [Phenylobacterium sp. J367]